MRRILCKVFSLMAVFFTVSSYSMGLDNVGVPLSDDELSSYRGGFETSTDRFISIGISMTSSINGQMIYNSHVADLLISNGSLAVSLNSIISGSGIVNVIQHGIGNLIELGSFSTIGNGNLMTIIQNTVDGSVLNNSTIIDISAPSLPVKSGSQYRNQIESAIFINQH